MNEFIAGYEVVGETEPGVKLVASKGVHYTARKLDTC